MIRRVILGRVTVASAVAALVELVFAWQCARVSVLASRPPSGFVVFEGWMLIGIEVGTLVVQRLVWLVGESARKPTAGSLIAFGWSGIGLALAAPAFVAALAIGAIAAPQSALLWVGMIVRRAWWTWLGRARTDRQHERLRAYWALSFRVQLVAIATVAALALVLSPRYGGLAEALANGSLVAAAAGLYFCVQAVFVLVRDPRVWAQRGFAAPATRDRRPRSAVARFDPAELAHRIFRAYPSLLPGIALIVLFAELLSQSTPVGASPVAWPLWLFGSAWLLMGGVAKALGVTTRSALGYGFERAGLSTLVGVGLWLLSLLALAASAALASAFGGYERGLAELPWQVEAWFGAGALVSLAGAARLWPSYVNPFVVEGKSYKGRWFAPSFRAAWQLTASREALWRASLPLAAIALVLIAPPLAALANGLALGGRVLAKLWLYAVALPVLALASTERVLALRAALSEPAPDP